MHFAVIYPRALFIEYHMFLNIFLDKTVILGYNYNMYKNARFCNSREML